jgi:hypothetical protein
MIGYQISDVRRGLFAYYAISFQSLNLLMDRNRLVEWELALKMQV